MSEGTRGRPKVHVDQAEKQRAYRERRRAADRAALEDARRRAVSPVEGTWAVEVWKADGSFVQLFDQLDRDRAQQIATALTPSLKKGCRAKALEVGRPLFLTSL